ncbi:MAG: D-alanine--D-alanine ligase [Rikenellaceae bacterium]|jgi:D-alanine-D-alanine ligase|nr:D-alanine--D-alanine ligase [Rikenellaceae bacterium]
MKNIAVFCGGDSSEREVSLGSGAQMIGHIDRSKYNPYLIDLQGLDWHYTASGGEVCAVDRNDFSLTVGGKKVMLEYALILIHGTPGEDGKLQGYLDMMRIPYSSGGVSSSVITFDKITCKRAVATEDIALAREVLVHDTDAVDPQAVIEFLGLPVFVKPNASGSSFGVTKVGSTDGIIPAIKAAMKESGSVLIEEFLDGREFGCGVMVTREKEYTFPVTEIISKKEFFDYEAKYTPGMSDEITPADIPTELSAEIQRLALKAYKVCDCRGVVRVDFIVRGGVPHMVEVNSVPGMSAGSIVPKQVAAAGMSLTDFFNILIEDTWQ